MPPAGVGSNLWDSALVSAYRNCRQNDNVVYQYPAGADARCGGCLRLVATVDDPEDQHAIRAILESLGLPAEASPPAPP